MSEKRKKISSSGEARECLVVFIVGQGIGMGCIKLGTVCEEKKGWLFKKCSHPAGDFFVDVDGIVDDISNYFSEESASTHVECGCDYCNQ